MVDVTVRLTKRQAEALLKQCPPPKNWYGHHRNKATQEAFDRVEAAIKAADEDAR